jgi:hypothetical protein
MTSQEQWSRVDLGYKLMKPKLRRKPGRLKVSRIKASDELENKKKRRCTKCNELGHTSKYCQGGPTTSQKRRVNASGEGTSDPIHVQTTKWHISIKF